MARGYDYSSEGRDELPAITPDPDILRSDRQEKQPFRPYFKPPNPSDPRELDPVSHQMFRGLLPEIEANSKDAEEFAVNLKHVLTSIFKRQYGKDPEPEEMRQLEMLMDLPLHMYRQQPDRRTMDRREELENYQRDFQDQTDGR